MKEYSIIRIIIALIIIMALLSILSGRDECSPQTGCQYGNIEEYCQCKGMVYDEDRACINETTRCPFILGDCAIHGIACEEIE